MFRNQRRARVVSRGGIAARIRCSGCVGVVCIFRVEVRQKREWKRRLRAYFWAWDSSSWERRRCASGVVVMYCEYFSTCKIKSHQRPPRARLVELTFANRHLKYDLTKYRTLSISVCTTINLKCSSSLVLGSLLNTSSICPC